MFYLATHYYVFVLSFNQGEINRKITDYCELINVNKINMAWLVASALVLLNKEDSLCLVNQS